MAGIITLSISTVIQSGLRRSSWQRLFCFLETVVKCHQYLLSFLLSYDKIITSRTKIDCSYIKIWTALVFWRTLRMDGEGNSTPLQYYCLENPMDGGAWWAAVPGVAKSRTWLSDFTFSIHFHALEKEMATHSSVLAWGIPGTGKPGGLPSMVSHRVGHDWSGLAAAAAASWKSYRWPIGTWKDLQHC